MLSQTSLKLRTDYQKTPLSKWKIKPQTWRKYLQYIDMTKDMYLEFIKNIDIKKMTDNPNIFFRFEWALYKIEI